MVRQWESLSDDEKRLADALRGFQEELDPQDTGSVRKFEFGRQDLFLLTEEVVDVLQRAVSDVEGMAAKAMAV